MAHNPSDAMTRLLNVALGGVLTLIGIAATGAGWLVTVASSEPGNSEGWRIGGMVVMGAGILIFLVGAIRTVYLVVDWRRHRDERSPRP
ncbi:MAG: hypothetical protein ACKVS6_00695 [Planctomycetota bacterium]